MSRPRGSVIRWVAVSMLACWPSLAISQYTDPTTPADSPLWWPVLDRTTPEELRAGHQREAVGEAYRVAVAAGWAPDCGPGFVPDEFVNSRTNPELVPVWHVLWRNFVLERGATSRDLVAEREGEIRRFGLSPDGLERLSRFAAQVDDEQERWQAELEERSAPMRELVLRFMAENPPPTDAEWRSLASAATADGRAATGIPEHMLVIDDLAAGRGDPLALSSVIGGSYADWVEWLRESDADPRQDAMETHLPSLRNDLSVADWTALRRYLSTVIGDHQSASYSLRDCPQAQFFQPAARERSVR